MCGITGFFSPHNIISREELVAMTVAIAHRGPDSEGVFFSELVGLGHRRLSILDLSEASNQPLTSQCGRFVIVYNGEVYNYKELASELNIKLKTTGDTEVILEAFAKIGPGFVRRLNGMFAIAIYDKVEKSLHLFRDRMGIKPIYYYWDGANFLFASELKSLTSIPKVAAGLSINKKSISYYLHLGYIPGPASIYNEIRKMGAGEHIMIKNNKLVVQKYWDPLSKIKSETVKNCAEVKKELKKLVESSVAYRMISDVPFGTFLSGGIDSSLITAVAQSLSTQPINTFSIGFEENKYNEALFARKISNYLGTNHHEFILTFKEGMEWVDKLTDIYDEPFADSSSIPTLIVSQLSRKYVTMTLSGDGGDELFMGYGMYDWAQRLTNPFIYLNKKIIGAILQSSGKDRYRRVAKLFDFQDGDDLKSHIFSQEQYLFSRKEIDELLTPEYITSFKLEEDYKKLSRILSAKEEQALFDLEYYLKDDLLVKVDRATMHFSLETRVPLLDYRIVEYALNIDEKLKIRFGEKKYILKQLLFDYIPKSFYNRPKWGFSIPLREWLKKDLKFLIEDNLSESAINATQICNYNKVKELKTKFYSGHDYLYNRIWLLINLQRWFLKKSNIN